MLLAGEQFAAARLAILTAVLTSLLAPDWMARSAVDGRCGMAASVSPTTSTAPAASIHLGVRSTGHPEGSRIVMVPPGSRPQDTRPGVIIRPRFPAGGCAGWRDHGM